MGTIWFVSSSISCCVTRPTLLASICNLVTKTQHSFNAQKREAGHAHKTAPQHLVYKTFHPKCNYISLPKCQEFIAGKVHYILYKKEKCLISAQEVFIISTDTLLSSRLTFLSVQKWADCRHCFWISKLLWPFQMLIIDVTYCELVCQNVHEIQVVRLICKKKLALSKHPNPALLSVAKQVQKRLSSKHDLRFQVKIWLYVHQNIKCIICSNRSPLRDDVLLYQIWRQTHFLRF